MVCLWKTQAFAANLKFWSPMQVLDPCVCVGNCYRSDVLLQDRMNILLKKMRRACNWTLHEQFPWIQMWFQAHSYSKLYKWRKGFGDSPLLIWVLHCVVFMYDYSPFIFLSFPLLFWKHFNQRYILNCTSSMSSVFLLLPSPNQICLIFHPFYLTNRDLLQCSSV